MVCPSALADTLTPPIASPAADLIVPVSRTSAASAVTGTKASVRPARTLANVNQGALVMAFLPSGSARLGRRLRRRYGLEVGDDRVDLGALEGMLEAGHRGRAVPADPATPDARPPAVD